MRKILILLSVFVIVGISDVFSQENEDHITIDKVNYSPKFANDYKRKQLVLGIVNDLFAPDNKDRHMTNSIKVGYITDQLPEFINWFEDPEAQNYYIATFNQTIYTPEDIEESEVIEDDRPFAGWTYLSVGIAKKKDRSISVTILDFGIVGEESLAEDVQVFMHELVDTREPRGWDNQLETEVGINLSHYRGENFRVVDEKFVADITPFIGGSVGNIRTSLTAGAVARFGYNVPDDALIGYTHDTEHDDFAFYGFLGAKANYIARDIFLDGNSHRDSHSVEKENYVLRAHAGVAVRYGNFEISYSYGVSSKEFKGQDGLDQGGMFLINYTKKF